MVLSRIEKPLFEKLNQNDLARLEPEISEHCIFILVEGKPGGERLPIIYNKVNKVKVLYIVCQTYLNFQRPHDDRLEC